MDEEERLRALRIIEREIGQVFKRSNGNLYFIKTTNDYLVSAATVAATVLPGGITPQTMILAFVLNRMVQYHFLPTVGHWRIKKEMASLRKKAQEKLEEWFEALSQVGLEEDEKIRLCSELNRVLEKIANQEDLDPAIQSIAERLITRALNFALSQEVTQLLQTIKKLKIEDIKLLHNNLKELEVLLMKVEKKQFSAENPLYYELDEDDEFTDKRKPYRKIYGFTDPSKDYQEEILELASERDQIKAKIKSMLEYHAQAFKEKEAELKSTMEDTTEERKVKADSDSGSGSEPAPKGPAPSAPSLEGIPEVGIYPKLPAFEASKEKTSAVPVASVVPSAPPWTPEEEDLLDQVEGKPRQKKKVVVEYF